MGILPINLVLSLHSLRARPFVAASRVTMVEGQEMNTFALALGLAANVLSTKPIPVQFAREVAGKNITICIDGRDVHSTFAGKLGFRDANHSWMSVCGNVRSPISGGQQFLVRPFSSADLGGNAAKAGNIVALYFREAQTPEQCAGLQLAVWEAIEDGGYEPNFLQGRFQAQADTRMIAFAQQYYTAIDTPGKAVFLQAGQNNGQSQVTVT